MQCLSLKEDNIIKDIRNIFKVKKKQNYGTVKDLKDLFRQEKQTKAIKDRIVGEV